MLVLEVDGIKLPQSAAIARFLAKQFHLASKDNLEQAKVDAVGDTNYDLVTAFLPSRFEHDAIKQEELTKKYVADVLPKHLENLEILSRLYGHGGPFFIGHSLTWVDLLFYDLVEIFQGFHANCLTTIHGLYKILQR